MKIELVSRRILLHLALCCAFFLIDGPADAQTDPAVGCRAANDGVKSISVHECGSFLLEGVVRGRDGSPAEGAVVVSTAGGQAVTDADGKYRLVGEAPPEAKSIRVTAVGGSDGKLVTSKQVMLAGMSGSAQTLSLQLAQSGSCVPEWLPTFGGHPGAAGVVNSLTVFDDGTGPALYAGGGFGSIAGVLLNRIAKWDGANWSPLGSGLNSEVFSLVVHDDGSGAALYVGGRFTEAGGIPAGGIAKWDGSSWSSLAGGLVGRVRAMAVFDDGGGDELYVGGG